MPSKSSLFFWQILSLVARCAKTVRHVAFVCRSARFAEGVFFCPLRERMFYSMFGGADHYKIFSAVVERVTVLVVYMKTSRGLCYYTVFVLPFVWFRNFYADVHQAAPRFVQTFGSNRDADPNFFQHRSTRCFGAICQRFSSAVRAARSIVVRIAVGTLSAYDLSAAKGAKFEGNFSRHAALYAKKHRMANAF